MRKIIATAVAVAGLYGAGTQLASASCMTGSVDGNNNSVITTDLGCAGIVTADTVTVDKGKPARMPGGLYSKSDRRLAAEAKVKAQLEQMARANTPALDQSFLSRLFAAMFNGPKLQALAEHIEKTRAAPATAAKPDVKPGAVAAPAVAPASVKTEDLFCMLDIRGEGRVMDIAIIVASNRKLKGTGSAKMLIAGNNQISSENAFPVNLKAGGSQTLPLMTTNSLKASALSVTFRINEREVACS